MRNGSLEHLHALRLLHFVLLSRLISIRNDVMRDYLAPGKLLVFGGERPVLRFTVQPTAANYFAYRVAHILTQVR